MTFELQHSFNWLTSGMIDSRFCRNPIWIAIIITIIIMIIIPLTQGYVLWRGIFIFLCTVILVFMYSASLSRKIKGSKELEDASQILEKLTYLDTSNQTDDIEVTPRLYVDSQREQLDDNSIQTVQNINTLNIENS